MQLARFLNKLFKEDGFILLDANLKKYIIGNPKRKNPIVLKILNKKLHYKLLFRPDLYFGEAYSEGEIEIENGTLTEFLDLALMNIGRGELNFFSQLINKLSGSYRYLTNFNFIKKSKMNVAHHYDLSDELYDLFLDPKRQYSCAYFKNENEPDKMDIGIFTFNQLNDWNQFWRDFNNAFTSKKNNFGAFPIVTGKTYAMFKSDAKPFHLSIISNADNKLALIDMRYDPTEEEREANYSKQIRMGWQNDKCEGGILID